MSTRKLIATAIAAATPATGDLAVAALNPLSSAGAEEQQHPTPGATHRTLARRVLGTVLDELVADGTLTQAQAGAVKGGVKDELKERREHRRELVGVVADTIGVSTEDLVAALKDESRSPRSPRPTTWSARQWSTPSSPTASPSAPPSASSTTPTR